MKRDILFILLTSIFLSCNGKRTETTNIEVEQQNLELPPPPKKIDENNLIGFACYNRGRESEPVKAITKLLEKENYNGVKEKLWSKSVAEKYLATVSCKKLQEINLISLKPTELKQIEENMISDEKVEVCSGCTHQQDFSLKELFSSKTFISVSVKKWLGKVIK